MFVPFMVLAVAAVLAIVYMLYDSITMRLQAKDEERIKALNWLICGTGKSEDRERYEREIVAIKKRIAGIK